MFRDTGISVYGTTPLPWVDGPKSPAEAAYRDACDELDAQGSKKAIAWYQEQLAAGVAARENGGNYGKREGMHFVAPELATAAIQSVMGAEAELTVAGLPEVE